MSSDARFKDGDSVIHRSTRVMGRVEGSPELDAGEYWYRVRFVERVENVVEDELDPVDEGDTSIEELVKRGRWGRTAAFRCALAVERISNENRSTVYSFNAQRILFHPYQYKPLLKILDSSHRRLLVADEVGLGKTIETGLILAEVEARRKLDRVLVVCPSRLRDKWREELNRKFDQDFEIYDRAGLREYIHRVREQPHRTRLRAIVSVQTIRNAELRESLLAEIGHVDMLVFDEVHHARNPATQTSEMLRDLAGISGYVLLLSATPLHLGSRDLFTLLNALRPTEFRDATVFESELRRHQGVLDAGKLVRQRTIEAFDDAKRKLKLVFGASVSETDDPLARQVIEDMEAGLPNERQDLVQLERRIQELHPLATILTRTRKRDVQEHAAVRRAGVLRCQWSSEEIEAYQQFVSRDCKDDVWISGRLSLGQIQRARQAASCLPAAIENYSGTINVSEEEMFESTDIVPSDVVGTLERDAPTEPSSQTWRGVDSKYEKFREILDEIWRQEPDAKVLVFSFFKGTVRYLNRRLNDDGHFALFISGDVPSRPKNPDQDERGSRIRQFRTDPKVRLLISTEVGSEGLDFQFCHHLVNYDLPWNPMVVEQRIGRIDRFGQKADVIHIHNLVVENTVEDRILHKLYDRIGIFRESLGDLEEVLGETMRDLRSEYVCGQLTAAESDTRVQLASDAINRQRLHLEELEKNASELFGHEQFIRDEMNRVGRLGRYVAEEALLAVLKNYLETHHDGIGPWDEGDEIYGIRLTDALRRDIENMLPPGQHWLPRLRQGRLFVTCDGEKAFDREDVELLNASHPLMRAAVGGVKKNLQDAVARVAQTVIELRGEDDREFPAGIYYLLVFSHTIEGIRKRNILETVAWSNSQGQLIETELSERLLHLVTQQGDEWVRGENALPMPVDVWKSMISAVRSRSREMREHERRENEALYVRRLRAIKAEYDFDRERKELRLQTARDRGQKESILRAFEGQISKTKGDYQRQLDELDDSREVSSRLSDPIAACVVEIRRLRAAIKRE